MKAHPGSAVLVIFCGLATPASADFFDSVTDLVEGAVDIVEGAVDGIGDLAEAIGDGIENLTKEGKKVIRKALTEVENVGKDIEDLVKTGKCSSDICDAVDAVAEYTKEVAQGAGDALKDAERRISEGKVLDAMWHLSIAPMDIQQEAAAHAAIKSSVLRAIGQAAATAYGGPKGAAAYSAWLTYHQSGGDLEAALKAGAIAGATSFAISRINDGVEVTSVGDEVAYDAALQRAVLTGAVSGTAVALSGGKQEDVEEAFLKGTVTSVIREGYRQITKADLEPNLKSSEGVAYCLGLQPNATGADGKRLPCLPDPDDYVPRQGMEVAVDDKGFIDLDTVQKVDGEYKFDFTKLDYGKPHVGTWSDLSGDAPDFSETSGLMTGISRIPGMNGMSVAHDIFDDTFNNGSNVIVEQVVRVGTIAPFVIMTYEGAGFSVHEMIRDAAKAESQAATVGSAETAPPANVGEGAEPVPPAETAEAAATQPAADSVDFDLVHLYCTSSRGPAKNYLMERPLTPARGGKADQLVCRIDQHISGDLWMPVWHAHNEAGFCLAKINDILLAYLDRDYTCNLSRGLRSEPAPVRP